MNNNNGIKLISDRDMAAKFMKLFGMEAEQPELPETMKFLGNSQQSPVITGNSGKLPAAGQTGQFPFLEERMKKESKTMPPGV